MPGGPRNPKGGLMPGGGGPRKPNGGGPGNRMKGRHLIRGKNLGPGGRNPPRYPPRPLNVCNGTKIYQTDTAVSLLINVGGQMFNTIRSTIYKASPIHHLRGNYYVRKTL